LILVNYFIFSYIYSAHVTIDFSFAFVSLHHTLAAKGRRALGQSGNPKTATAGFAHRVAGRSRLTAVPPGVGR
jgi:hypothetical protein